MGEKPLEGSRLRRIGPVKWVIPPAGERTHIRGTPWSRDGVWRAPSGASQNDSRPMAAAAGDTHPTARGERLREEYGLV